VSFTRRSDGKGAKQSSWETLGPVQAGMMVVGKVCVEGFAACGRSRDFFFF
jgi:hypothetical protein